MNNDLSEVIENAEPGAGEVDLGSPGARLRAERERQGFGEEELAEKLHITRHYLRAIEEDAYDKLPGVVFARGYIRNYCLLLEMPTEPLMTMFEGLVEIARKEKEAEENKETKKTKQKHQKKIIIMRIQEEKRK